MVTLTSAINAMSFKELQKHVWCVVISYNDAPDSSSVWVFRTQALAQQCFNKLVPSKENIETSEQVRVAHFGLTKNDYDYIHSREYYLEQGYYNHWVRDEWDDPVMDYGCFLEKYTINDTWDGVL